MLTLPPPQPTINSVTPRKAVASTAPRRSLPSLNLAIRKASSPAHENTIKPRGDGRTGIFNQKGSPHPLAVVVTVTVKLAGVVPLRLADAGVTVHVAAVGTPLHWKATVPT